MNRFLFPRWTNKFLPVLGILLLAGGGYAGTLFLAATDDKTINPGYQPTQPVPFSHKIHAGELKMDCRYCHIGVDKAAAASVPPTATCINCHSPDMDGKGPQFAAVRHDSTKLRAVHESWKSKEDSVPWIRIHRLPDFVFFNHSAHVNRGVSCVECHGRIDTMEKVYQAKELSMAWCIECHNDPTARLRPLDQVTNLSWEPEEGKTREQVGKEIREKFEADGNAVHPRTNCAVCHR
ncbi:MAG: cytochrome c3 family protein [Pirellulales bacterium]